MEGKAFYHFLLQRYINGTATEAEVAGLFAELEKRQDDEEWEAMINEFIMNAPEDADYDPGYWQPMIEKIVHTKEQATPVRRMARWTWWAAASIILLLCGGAYYFFVNDSQSPPMTTTQPVAGNDAIAPGRDGALLTLADGTKLTLDSTGNRVIAHQNGAQVVMKNGQLTYLPLPKTSPGIAYNIMSTPNGRQFQLALPDGSKVWLNAGSTIKYPTAFDKNKRIVEIEGEAYFEITKDKTRPFRVKIYGGAYVEVLGTKFNINAYNNEELVKTTLVEGSVRVRANKWAAVLKPGQQASISNDQHSFVQEVDIAPVLAWKNGYFDFTNADLRLMMRQLERWYDINVVYKGHVPDVVFRGKMDRNVQLSDVIRFLTDFGIEARLEGRSLIISGT